MSPIIQFLVLTFCTRIMVIAATTNPNDLAVLNAIISSWENLPPDWKGSDPCGSSWEGINCVNSRVTSLVLAGMNVRGSSIGDIPSLSELQYLDLSNNKGLKGTLPPSIQNLKNLTTLILVGCDFFGPIPDTIGSLNQLIFLALNNNSFTGSIPPSIGNLTRLSWLDLSNNKLSGTIPISNRTAPGLDTLVNTKHFHLAKNQLSGTIPPQLFSSKMNLIHVIFDNNQLYGSIPSTLGLVGTLEVVRLDWNSLSGTVPQNLTNLKNLSELYLSNNNLTGPVPDLGGMNSLYYVDMSNNSFDISDVPTWFTELPSITTLLMDKAQLRGQIPSDVFQPQLEKLVLSNNILNGTLDVGTSYSSDLILDLNNNSIIDFKQKEEYNISLSLADNPVCEGTEATERYCAIENPNSPNVIPSNTCAHVACSSNKVQSPNCKCAHPYTGTIYFFSYSFSNLENTTYYTILHGALMQAFLSNQLPIDSISITNASIDVYSYLQYKVHIFPSGQDHFNRSVVSSIGTALNRQLFSLPHFGPLFFLDESYCCFPGEKKSLNLGVIIGATVGGFVLVILIALAGLYAFYQKRQAVRAKQNSPFASWALDNGSGVGGVPQLKGARCCSFEELSRCTYKFSEGNIIGSGGYGKVYKGTLNTGQVVAIKRAQQGSMQGAHEFKTEIELLSRIHHKNVVALVGFCYEQGEQMLVYEYISNGTLKDNLSGNSGIRLDWMRRLRIALDAARGLTYLHELANPPIIHRDIKSTNILLDHKLNAKVADFGLSKLLGDESKGYVSTQVKGTLGYMDPEYYMTQQLTEKSDVYSFGVVLLELLTARSPIQKGQYVVREVKIAIDNPNKLHEILDPSLGPGPSIGGLTKFVDLAMSCVQDSGTDRPKMAEVAREIESIMEMAALSPDAESALTLPNQNTSPYHPDGDSVSDESSLFVPFETDLRR